MEPGEHPRERHELMKKEKKDYCWSCCVQDGFVVAQPPQCTITIQISCDMIASTALDREK